MNITLALITIVCTDCMKNTAFNAHMQINEHKLDYKNYDNYQTWYIKATLLANNL